MANPIIFWDDGSVALKRPTSAEIATENSLRGSGTRAPVTGAQVTELASPRTDVVARGGLAIKLRSRRRTLYSAIFAHDAETRHSARGYTTNTGSYITVGDSPAWGSQYIFVAPSVSGLTSVVASANILELVKPSQEGSYPRTASKEWQLFPQKSTLGGYFGANSRRTHGNLKLEIDNVPIAWIEQYWEPMREHLAAGGVIVYALDYEKQPDNIALCYAKTNVAPKVSAGGFGSVSADLGTATIIGRRIDS